MTHRVLAAHHWKDNGALIEDVAALGYLRKEWRTLDPAYGNGIFWKRWRPTFLVGSDILTDKSPVGYSQDFRDMPWGDAEYDAVVLDPPYKLNGTSAEAGDSRYGVDVKATWQDRHRLIRDGMKECARVLKPCRNREDGGFLLLKCQDQVCSGRVRWQTVEFTNYAADLGLRLVDRFDLLGTSRPQPIGRRQVHAHGRPSTLLVFGAS